MPGIVGLVTPTKPNQNNILLPQLVQGLLPSETEVVLIQSAAFGIGTASRTKRGEPAFAQSASVVLCFLGQIALEQVLDPPIPRTGEAAQNNTLARKLLALYEQGGSAALQALNGQYVIVIWNVAQQALEIVNDRYGLAPFYYWTGENEIVFSSTIRAIARYPNCSRQINPNALFDLLATGQMLGERTLLQAIQALPPACTLRYQHGQLTISRYWMPSLYQSGDPALPAGDDIGGLSQALRQAIQQHTQPGSILLLTGGFDSRLLAGFTTQLHGREYITAHTIGHPEARDARLAKTVAHQLGLKHHLIPVNPRFLSEYSKECVLRSEGNMNCTAGWILGETQYCTPGGTSHIITGVGAEVVSGRHWMAELNERDPAIAIEKMCNEHWTFKSAASLMRPRYRDDLQDASKQLLAQCLQDAPSDDPLSCYDYLHLTQYRRHPTGNILSADVVVDEPFYDNALVDFALRIPPQQRLALYMETIVQTFPRLAEIETSERRLSIPDVLGGKKNHALVLERFFNRVISRVSFPALIQLPYGDAYWNTIYPNHWLRTTTRDFVTTLFQKLPLLDEWVDIEQANQLLADHLAGRKHAARLIGALMTAILFMDMVLE